MTLRMMQRGSLGFCLLIGAFAGVSHSQPNARPGYASLEDARRAALDRSLNRPVPHSVGVEAAEEAEDATGQDLDALVEVALRGHAAEELSRTILSRILEDPSDPAPFVAARLIPSHVFAVEVRAQDARLSQTLLRLFNGSEDRRPSAAALALAGRYASPETLTRIVRLLLDSGTEADVLDAQRLLAECGASMDPDKTFEAVLQMGLPDDTHPTISAARLAALRVLVRRDAGRAIRALDALAENDPDVPGALLLRCVGSSTDPTCRSRTSELVVRILIERPDDATLAGAIEAAGDLRLSHALPLILRRVYTTSSDDAWVALMQAIPRLVSSDGADESPIDELEPFVREAFASESGRVVAAAIRCAHRLQMLTLAPLLPDLIGERHPKEVRVAALEALPALLPPTPATTKLLLPLLDDPQVAPEAWKALSVVTDVEFQELRAQWYVWRSELGAARERGLTEDPTARGGSLQKRPGKWSALWMRYRKHRRGTHPTQPHAPPEAHPPVPAPEIPKEAEPDDDDSSLETALGALALLLILLLGRSAAARQEPKRSRIFDSTSDGLARVPTEGEREAYMRTWFEGPPADEEEEAEREATWQAHLLGRADRAADRGQSRRETTHRIRETTEARSLQRLKEELEFNRPETATPAADVPSAMQAFKRALDAMAADHRAERAVASEPARFTLRELLRRGDVLREAPPESTVVSSLELLIEEAERLTAGTGLAEVAKQASFLMLKMAHCVLTRASIPEGMIREWESFLAQVDSSNPGLRRTGRLISRPSEPRTTDVSELPFSEPKLTVGAEEAADEPATMDVSSLPFSEAPLDVGAANAEPTTTDVEDLPFSDEPLEP